MSTHGRDKALYVFTHRHIAAGRLAGGVPLACNMARRPDLPCIPSGAVADVLGMGGRDCGLVDLAGLRACLDIAADLTSGGDALHVWH